MVWCDLIGKSLSTHLWLDRLLFCKILYKYYKQAAIMPIIASNPPSEPYVMPSIFPSFLLFAVASSSISVTVFV